MNNGVKKIIILALALVLVIPTVVYGESAIKSITIRYNNIKVSLDGKLIDVKDSNGNTVEPFIFNGTTYLPVRSVAEAAGKEVLWDEYTNTVILGEPGKVEIPEYKLPTNTSGGHDVSNPVPAGTIQKVHEKSNGYEFDADVYSRILCRGKDANYLVEQAFSFNPKPDDGYEYAIVSVEMKISNASCFAENVDDKETISVSSWAFKGIGKDGKYIETPSIEIFPEPALNHSAKSGDTISGRVVVQLRKGEKGMMVFGGPVGNQSGGTVFELD